MCRRLPDGTYRYCPSRAPRPRSGSFNSTSSGHLRHRGTMTVEAALDGLALCAQTGTPLAAETITAMAALATQPLSAAQKWQIWTKITSGTSISTALTAMLDSGLLAQFPELAALDGVPQDPRWHPEGDALTHLGQTADHMARQCDRDGITGEDRTLLVLAATLHDLGKATHTHREDDGRITSYGHDDAGVAPAHRFLAAMDAPQRLHDIIEPLIREHMCVASVRNQANPSIKTVQRLVQRLAPATIEQWVRVVNADHGGRGTASVDHYADGWLKVAAQAAQIGQVTPPVSDLLTGHDLIAVGLRPSPRFSEILAAARVAENEGIIVDQVTAHSWLRHHLDI